jgi:hypothetical protein
MKEQGQRREIRNFRNPIAYLPPAFTLVSRSAYSSAL